MSQTSVEAINAAAAVDWQTAAAGIATFLATLVTIVWGWFQGRKKLDERIRPGEGVDVPVVAGIIQDNMTIRESTAVSKEVRDQLLLLNHTIQQNTKNQDDVCDELREITSLLRKLIRTLEDR